MTSEAENSLLGWADSRNIKLSKSGSHSKRDYFHVSSANCETFQFVVEPPVDGRRRIDMHLIESQDDEQSHFVWEFPESSLILSLDTALDFAKRWFDQESL